MQKSISKCTLSTSVQVLTKNKPYYLETNLGLMKIRVEVLPETQRFDFEFENFQKVRENVRAASETEDISTHSEHVLVHSQSSSHSTHKIRV